MKKNNYRLLGKDALFCFFLKSVSKKLILTSLIMFIFCASFSQQLINAGGKSEQNSVVRISYSIGQTFSSAAQNVVLVPYEIQVVSSSPLIDKIDLSCEVFPNPASKYIYLKLDNPAGCEFQIYLSDGKLLEQKEITKATTKISVSEIKAQAFFVTVLANHKKLKTYKIIKN